MYVSSGNYGVLKLHKNYTNLCHYKRKCEEKKKNLYTTFDHLAHYKEIYIKILNININT